MEVSFLCEWITPALWHGAHPKGTPEVRSASLKGLLRYWWRILYQDCATSTKDYSSLFKRESELFGSTERASPLIVRVEGQESSKPICICLGSPPYDKLGYFLFPLRKSPQEAIAPGSTFRVILTLRKGQVNSIDPLREAIVSFWFLAHLGSIGSRSRRGMGSFFIKEAKCENGKWEELFSNVWSSFPVVKEKSPSEYGKELKAQFMKWTDLLPCRSESSVSDSLLDFPKLNTLEVWLWKEKYNTWHEALAEVAASLSKYRSRHKPDYSNVKNALAGWSSKLTLPIERIGFGLPIVFYFRSLRGASGVLQGEEHDRRASPLWLKVVKLEDDSYTIQATFLRANILPSNERLKLKTKIGNKELEIRSGSSIGDSSELLKYVQEWLSPSNSKSKHRQKSEWIPVV